MSIALKRLHAGRYQTWCGKWTIRWLETNVWEAFETDGDPCGDTWRFRTLKHARWFVHKVLEASE